MQTPRAGCCHLCKGTGHESKNFILTCCACQRGFHHRCHMPPVPDPVMVALVANRESGLTWKCVYCKRKDKKRGRQESVQPILSRAGHSNASVRSSSATPVAGPSSRQPPNWRATPEVIELSDDEVEEVSPAIKLDAAGVKGGSPVGAPRSSRSSLRHKGKGTNMGSIISLLEDDDKIEVDEPIKPPKAEPQAAALPSSSVSAARVHPQSAPPAYVPAYLKMSGDIGRDWEVDLSRKPNRSLPSFPPIPDESKLPLDDIGNLVPRPKPLLSVENKSNDNTARKPRKLPAKKLTRSRKTLSQRSYTMVSSV